MRYGKPLGPILVVPMMPLRYSRHYLSQRPRRGRGPHGKGGIDATLRQGEPIGKFTASIKKIVPNAWSLPTEIETPSLSLRAGSRISTFGDHCYFPLAISITWREGQRRPPGLNCV